MIYFDNKKSAGSSKNIEISPKIAPFSTLESTSVGIPSVSRQIADKLNYTKFLYSISGRAESLLLLLKRESGSASPALLI